MGLTINGTSSKLNKFSLQNVSNVNAAFNGKVIYREEEIPIFKSRVGFRLSSLILNPSFAYFTLPDGSPSIGSASDPLVFGGLGESPSCIKSFTISYNDNSQLFSIRLTLNPGRQFRPRKILLKIDGMILRAGLEIPMEGFIDESSTSIVPTAYDSLAYSSSLLYPENYSADLPKVFSYMLEKAQTQNSTAFDIEIFSDETQKYINQAVIGIGVNEDKLGYIEESSTGAIVPNYWNQLQNPQSQNSPGMKENINEFSVEPSGKVVLRSNFATDYRYYDGVRLLINNKRYYLARVGGSTDIDRRSIRAEYQNFSIEKGLEIYDIFNSNSQISYEVTEETELFYSAQVKFEKEVDPVTGLPRFITKRANRPTFGIPEVGEFITDTGNPGVRYEVGSYARDEMVVTIDEENKAGLMTYNRRQDRFNTDLRVIYFDSQVDPIITLITDVDSNAGVNLDDKNENYEQVKKVFDYLDSKQGEYIFIECFINGTPWVNPLEN